MSDADNGQSWALGMGANPTKGRGEVEFRVWAPFAKKIELELASTGGRSTRLQLEKEAGGEVMDAVYSTTVKRDGPLKYAYVLDGKKRRPDPVARYQPDGVHGASEFVDPEDFGWTDRGWRGVPERELLIYEVHVGTYTPSGTFESLLSHIDHLRDEMGITALELMPVAQFPGDRNWGYDGVSLYAPQNSYGGPAGLKRLVNECHNRGLAVILDVVYNHLGPEGNYLNEFGPYFSDKYRTPWGSAVNYDDRGCDRVRRFVVENALYWVTEYHFDGLRLDAVHGIFDFSPRHILTEIGDAVHLQGQALGRELHVIAESDLNDPKVISSKGDGGYGLDAQWSDDFHHAVHAYLTGERSRYYQDFGALGDIAKALREGFVYDGRYSRFRGRVHGASSASLPGERFVICLQNHDQVGNRPDGARLSTLLSPSALKLAVGLLLLAPNVPLLFMGEEFCEKAPFYYFISHTDQGLVEAVRQGRKKETEGQPGQEYVDPQDPSTFERSKVNHDLLKEPPNRAIFQYYRRLIELRKAHPALKNLDRKQMEVRQLDDRSTLIVRRWETGVEELATVYVMGSTAVLLDPFPGGWTRVFDSGDWAPEHTDGVGRSVPPASSSLGSIELAPYSVTVFVRSSSPER